MILQFKKTTRADCEQAALNAREQDAKEFCDASGLTLQNAITTSWLHSLYCQSVFAPDSGKLVCIFGYAGLAYNNKTVVQPWMITTQELDRAIVRRAFARASKIVFRQLRKNCPRQENYVAADYKASVRWLAWLGYNVEVKAKPYGPYGALFCRFTL